GQDREVHQQILTAGIGSKSTPDSRKMSSKKLKDRHSEADKELHLPVGSPFVLLDAKASVSQNVISSIAQKKEVYASENSVNTLSSSMEISLKTRKRLNFEDKSALKEVEIANKIPEIEDKVSEEPQERKSSRASQKRVPDLEDEILPQTKKSFSTLFLETVKRKSESSPIVRHIATAPLHSSPSNDVNLLEDEFIIDESERSFASRSWITIPRKAGPLKQCTVNPAENSALLQSKKSREKHHSVSPANLTSDRHCDTAYPVEKSQPSKQKRLGKGCALANELENHCGSTKYEMCNENAEKSSRKKKTIKQKQRRKCKDNVLEEQVDVAQSKEKNTNMSHITQGSRKHLTNVPYKKEERKEREYKKKHYINDSRRDLLKKDIILLTISVQRQIKRHLTNFYLTHSERGLLYSNSPRRNELLVCHNSRRKPTEKSNQSTKNIEEKTIPFKGQKRTTSGSSRAQDFLNAKDSGRIIDHDEISSCSQNESLENDKEDLAKKKNLLRGTRSTKDQDNMSEGNVHQESQIKGFTHNTPAESNLDSREPKISVLERSGPCRLKNYLTPGRNNSDVDDKEVQETSSDSRVKISTVIPEDKIHHKLVLPSNTPNVRRTKRTRLKPLEYWRGERIDYHGRPSGGFVIGGILSPDTVSSKRKSKGDTGRVNKMVARKRICLDNEERKNKFMVNLNIPLGDPLKPTRVKDPETREIIPMDLLRPRDTYQFCVEHGDLKVYKTLDTPIFSAGKLILGPHQEKGKQHVGSDILVFYVNFGDLLCTLHETPYIITTGDSFYVPSGNYYNIKNLLNEESVLLFTQIKR
uniref:Centromere protein C n=1 Tax=Neovison vison TaxID=452646 RepID=A0A8C7BGN6_NEOVI